MTKPEETSQRWPLFKDAVAFQIKLSLDALRDILLSPVSMICIVVDLVKGHTHDKSLFYKLMRLGHESDSWLNLFGTRSDTLSQSQKISSQCDANNSNAPYLENNADQLIEKLEKMMNDSQQKGELTTSAKLYLKSYLNKLASKDKR